MPITLGPDDLKSTLASLGKAGLLKGIAPMRLGEASAAHFLAPEQVGEHRPLYRQMGVFSRGGGEAGEL